PAGVGEAGSSGSAASTYSEEQIPLYEINTGDKVLIRNEEIIPMDGILRSGHGWIDYSFVTGEAAPVAKRVGDRMYAGGRQRAGSIEVEVLKPVEQSYLTQLWSHEVFSKRGKNRFESITDRISGKFTIAVLSIAFLAALFWVVYDPSKVFNVFTAVLIVACPCAIALAAPFTLGNLLRIFGVHRLYLKDATVLEEMATVDTIVFDKTGTLTTHQTNTISYQGVALSEAEQTLLTSSLRASNHPLSRALYALLDDHEIDTLDEFEEAPGMGIKASCDSGVMKIGSRAFVGAHSSETHTADAGDLTKTAVHISSNDTYKGCYMFHNEYRPGVAALFKVLGKDKSLVVLSGDNDGERNYLEQQLPAGTALLFNQKPEDKLEYIESLQRQGCKVLMVGDGLNDAGALAQSDVGIVLSENINVFSPASDAIMDASTLQQLPDFLGLAKKGTRIIQWSFLLSLVYNLIGLSFAVAGLLEPVIAAILMPLSSISIVVFTTLMSRWIGRRLVAK
ncbi:MAG: heavy metal translocating P-type ATPase, partial [Bacteroidota bacterium]